MRSGKKYLHHDTTGEFELDLAPLLAVMVKLVPVLLVSSAFVQMMIVETDLPQAVKEAIQQDQKKPDTQIFLQISREAGFSINIHKADGNVLVKNVPLKDGAYDLVGLHQMLVAVKRENPKVFKLSLQPAGAVDYGDIVHVMDEARRARDSQTTFPIVDEQTQKETQTPFMFPEVVFANALEAA